MSPVNRAAGSPELDFVQVDNPQAQSALGRISHDLPRADILRPSPEASPSSQWIALLTPSKPYVEQDSPNDLPSVSYFFKPVREILVNVVNETPLIGVSTLIASYLACVPGFRFATPGQASALVALAHLTHTSLIPVFNRLSQIKDSQIKMQGVVISTAMITLFAAAVLGVSLPMIRGFLLVGGAVTMAKHAERWIRHAQNNRLRDVAPSV